MVRVVILLMAMAIGASPSTAQIAVLDSFNPSQSGGLCGMGTDPTTGNVWVHQCSSATIEGYSSTGTFLVSLPRPGEAANDVDIEFAPETLTLGATTIPAGTMLFINGETAVADIYAIDTGTGTVLGTLHTGFGVGHVVGGGYDAIRDAFFLVQDRVPGGAAGNLVAEIDPVTGAVLNSFQIGSDFDVNYGDLDVSTVSGHLLVVSSLESSLGEFTPTGDFVTTHTLPAGVSNLSGIALECAHQDGWVASTSGSVWRLGGMPCGSPTAIESAGGDRFALQPNYPEPFTSQTNIRFTLPRSSSVQLAVYDLRGRRVRTLVDGPLPAGPHTALWNGADDTDRPLPSGAYFCRLFAGGVTVMQSAVLLR